MATAVCAKRRYDQITHEVGGVEWSSEDPVHQRPFKRMRAGNRAPVKIAATLPERIQLARRAFAESVHRADDDMECCMQNCIEQYRTATSGLIAFDGSRVFTEDEMKTVMRLVLDSVKRRNNETFQMLGDQLVYLLECTEAPKPGELSYIS